MRHQIFNTFPLLLLIFSNALDLQGESPARIVGSSAAFPFMSALVEYFAQKTTDFHPPLVEVTGTGSGIQLFCQASPHSPSLVSTSRPMSQAEKKVCRKNGRDFFEISLGVDAVVLVTQKTTPLDHLSFQDVCKALRNHPPSLAKTWQDIQPRYPKIPIKIFAPSPAAGTRESFDFYLMNHCQSLDGYSLRHDSGFVEIGGHENILIQKLLLTQNTLGIVSYIFLQHALKALKPLAIDGVYPDQDTIKNETYPLRRKMYVYVYKKDLETNASLQKFIKMLVSERIMGDAGYLKLQGLVPLKKDDREAQRTHLQRYVKKTPTVKRAEKPR